MLSFQEESQQLVLCKAHREVAARTPELEKYMITFNEEAHILCDKLAEEGGVELSLHKTICLSVVRIVLFAILGVEIDTLEPDPCIQEQLVNEIIICMKTFSALMLQPWKAFDGFMWMSPEGRALKRTTWFVRDVTKRYIAALRASKHKVRTHLNSLLLEENLDNTKTDGNIRDEIMTLAMTATETTAGAMAYTLCLLGLHPEWQEAAQRQLDEVFGSGGDYLRPATTEDLTQLTVIDAVIKETLRLFPPNPELPRILGEDVSLAGGRYTAPRGCCVVASVFATHRHPGLYPDPDKFDPGRFLPGGSATCMKSTSYYPFGTGARRCLGAQFASVEMRVLLAMILRRFTVLPGTSREEMEDILLSLTSHPITGFQASFLPREKILSEINEAATAGIST